MGVALKLPRFWVFLKLAYSRSPTCFFIKCFCGGSFLSDLFWCCPKMLLKFWKMSLSLSLTFFFSVSLCLCLSLSLCLCLSLSLYLCLCLSLSLSLFFLCFSLSLSFFPPIKILPQIIFRVRKHGEKQQKPKWFGDWPRYGEVFAGKCLTLGANPLVAERAFRAIWILGSDEGVKCAGEMIEI